MNAPTAGTWAIVVPSQTLSFGSLTLASAGGGAPNGTYASASITSGNALGHWQIASSGIITPTSAGHGAGLNAGPYTLGLLLDDVASVTVITIEANTYTVASITEVTAAITDIGTANSGARTIKCRAGNYVPVTNTFRGLLFTNTVTITKADVAMPVFSAMDIRGTNNFVIDGLEITSDQSVILVTIRAASDLVTVQNCWLHGRYRDPNADYSSGDYLNPQAFGADGTAAPTRVVIQNNLIEDVLQAIVFAKVGVSISILNNTIRRTYTDAIHISGTETSLQTGTTVVSGNVASQPIGVDSDAGNPHVDVIQLLIDDASSLNWTGITVTNNRGFIGDARGQFQGLGAFCGVGTNYIENPTITGNCFATNMATGIDIEAIKDGVVSNNTVVTWKPGTSLFTTGIILGFGGNVGGHNRRSLGNITVTNNVSEAINLGGSATFTSTNNALLGHDGVTIPYTTAFVGPSFGPVTIAQVLSEFAPKPGGPLDASPTIGALPV